MNSPEPVSGRHVARDFTFQDGTSLDAVTLAYRTLGTPHRDADGAIDNAVLLLHGTGGSGAHFLAPDYAQAMFGPGQPLDAEHHYLILPDSIGHGGSSKPSDGLRMAFPHYDYADMVEGHRRLLTEHLGIETLWLVMGFSMGGMLTFQWAATHPDMAQAFIPMGCNPVEIGGLNRMQRKLQIDAIKSDPAWQAGNYAEQPVAGLRAAAGITQLMIDSPLAVQTRAPTRAAADRLLDDMQSAMAASRDANDTIYATDASRTYNPWDRLDRIAAPLLWINIEDDLINPPNLDIIPEAVKRMGDAEFVLVPTNNETRGHMSLLMPPLWADHVARFLRERTPLA